MYKQLTYLLILFDFFFYTDSPPRLIWTHEGSGDYIDGVNHVTHYHGNHQYDCLETTQAGHYLIFIQLTYQYSDKLPLFMVKSYFTLTRFRNNKPYVVAKSDHVVPPRKQRIGTVTKQPFTMVRSDSLRTGDRLCVMVSNPELIYASKIDNFFGIVALWRWQKWGRRFQVVIKFALPPPRPKRWRLRARDIREESVKKLHKVTRWFWLQCDQSDVSVNMGRLYARWPGCTICLVHRRTFQRENKGVIIARGEAFVKQKGLFRTCPCTCIWWRMVPSFSSG